MSEEKININVDDGHAFFSNEMSVNFNPIHFFLDFRKITPRNDPRSKGRPSILCEHNVVVADPYHAKQILNVLANMVKAYEKEYGQIKKPKNLEALEKKRKKAKEEKKDQTKAPSYFG